MIASFKDKSLEEFYYEGRKRRLKNLPANLYRVLQRKLDMLQHAFSLDDLRVPPANRLEALKGPLKGYYSIRVNQQWRLIFRWQAEQAFAVELIDYHQTTRKWTMDTRLPKNPTHPGEMLLEEFLKPMNMTQVDFAGHLGVSFKRINEIVNGRRAVSPETAWLFAQALGTSPQFWMNLQTTYDLVHHKTKKQVKILRHVV